MKDSILGFIRHILTFGGGFLVQDGLIDASQVETVTGAIITLVGVVWSVIDKKSRAE